MFSVLFCFEKISWNKTKPNDVSETFRIYVSTLASRKGGWCGFRLTFPVRVSMGLASLAMDLCFQDHVELSQGPNNSHGCSNHNPVVPPPSLGIFDFVFFI